MSSDVLGSICLGLWAPRGRAPCLFGSPRGSQGDARGDELMKVADMVVDACEGVRCGRPPPLSTQPRPRFPPDGILSPRPATLTPREVPRAPALGVSAPELPGTLLPGRLCLGRHHPALGSAWPLLSSRQQVPSVTCLPVPPPWPWLRPHLSPWSRPALPVGFLPHVSPSCPSLSPPGTLEGSVGGFDPEGHLAKPAACAGVHPGGSPRAPGGLRACRAHPA